MFVCPARRVVEDDLVRFPVDRPEVGGAHLPRRHATGFDGGLVHGNDAALADMCGLGRRNRFQQVNSPSRPTRQTAPTHPDAGIGQSLMLAVEGKVVAELVNEHPGQEAHVPRRCAPARSAAPAA